MSTAIINSIKQYLEEKEIPIIRAASAEALNQKAPEGFRPKDYLPESKSVLIIAKPAPITVFTTPKNKDLYSFFISSYQSYYKYMNELTNLICMKLEKNGYPSLPIPTYSPLALNKGKLHGLISFKHAAVEAGLGVLGKNTILIHPKEGNNLRLSGIITTLEWPTEGKGEKLKRCPKNCVKCIEACPVGALSDGSIDQVKCLTRSTMHSLVPPQFVMRSLAWISKYSDWMNRFLELFILSFFENYGIGCLECFINCPYFPGNKKAFDYPSSSMSVQCTDGFTNQESQG